jgi:benzoate-CoA ligase family protein
MSTPFTLIPGAYNAAVDLVDRHVIQGRGSRPAFTDHNSSLNYFELQARTNQFANALGRLGIVRENRIVLIMQDTIDLPVAFLGAMKAGVVPIPLNTLLPPETWRYMIADSGATAVVITGELYDQAAHVLDEINRLRRLQVIVVGAPSDHNVVNFNALLNTCASHFDAVPTHADDTAFWLYSSGSTGMPKGTRHIHSSLMKTAELYGQNVLGIGPDDVIFSAAKLFFAYGLGNSLSFPLSVGASSILFPGRPTPESVGKVLKDHNPTILCGAPTLFTAMLARPDIGRGAGSSRLRLTSSAGEALPEEIGKRWQQIVGTEVIDGIGSTEMLHIFLSNRPGSVRYGTSGKPVPGYDARIIDDSGADVPVGEIGELIIRGPTASDGYWHQREKSRRTFRGEWTYTGDKYRIAEDGNYVYCGRTDDMFKVSGNWVSPFEVESVLIANAAVLEAAVVGKMDSDGLMKPKAFLVLKPGYEPSNDLFETLKTEVKAQAGAWKYPRWMEIRSELPKTATGKIQRYKLRDE